MNFRGTFVWHRSRSPSRVFEPRVVLSETQRDMRQTANRPQFVAQVTLLQELVMHVRCIQCPGSALVLNLVAADVLEAQ